jgi:hypothetical protein
MARNRKGEHRYLDFFAGWQFGDQTGKALMIASWHQRKGYAWGEWEAIPTYFGTSNPDMLKDAKKRFGEKP